ncbi:hypothetical protein LSH36_464g01007 [Paralvinella palmiformis]|uniref:Uncharacterized protein n=1 Tax=Paralvinella palmiformis TaxID=53620 RepID=A0AAD9MYR6_9ANNE|nr:hypothetical protein LSH36_464g01007 [Paralvinella palmiformis]
MEHVRPRANDTQNQSVLPAPSIEEHACDVPLNVSELESATATPAPDAAEQTAELPEVKVSEKVPSPKPIIIDTVPICRSSRLIKSKKILDL